MAARERRLALIVAAAAPIVLAVAVLIGSTPDEEEYRFAILGSLLYVRQLADGILPTWTSSLGLGVPLPLVPNFQSHPLVPLLLALSPVTWSRLFYLAHTILGAVGVWRLGAALGLRPLVTAVCVFTFLLATPTHNYLMTDFWPSHYLVWTSAPWLLLGAWRVLESEGRALRRSSVLLGLMAGLVVANTNPGHVVVYAVVVVAVAVAHWRAAIRRVPWLAVAALIAGLMAAPNLLQLARERAVFDPDLAIVKLPAPLPASALWDVFLRPLTDPRQSNDVVGFGPSARSLFFGGPFAVLSLLGAAWCWRRHFALVLGFVMSAVLLFTPALPITFASRFHFRDPLTLCAVLLAGAAATRLLEHARYAVVIRLLLAAQLVVVALTATPGLLGMLGPAARSAMWARGGAGEGPAADRVAALVVENGRLAYSPQVEYDVYRGGYVDDGLGLNSLAFRGVPLVTGLFKGVSTAVLWPDDRLFYGRVRIPSSLAESSEGLDLLGIRYVLARAGEPVAPDLTVAGSVQTQRDTLVLHENRDAWPGAFLIASAAGVPEAGPAYDDCSNDRLLCRDLALLARLRLSPAVTLARRGGRIDVTVPSSGEERLLVVAEMFRPDWTATAGGRPLETRSVGPGLLAVAIPPATTSVTLHYWPPLLVLATLAAWTTAGLAVLWLLVTRRRPADLDRVSSRR